MPEERDLDLHRSYHYQELTTRGTVEFRSICTQPWERTFAPIAFHLGLLENLEAFEAILRVTDFFQLQQPQQSLHRQFSTTSLTLAEAVAMADFSGQLLSCAKQGLEKRGYGEEVYLESIKKH